jgi:hypothetical protein
MGPCIIEHLEELVEAGHATFRLKADYPTQLTPGITRAPAT